VPIFGLVTTITSNQQERTTLNAIGRVCAMIAAMLVTVIIPVFRQMIGGWTATIVMLSVVGAITMVPICFTAKEHVAPPPSEKEVGVGEMLRYLKSNKYLLIYYICFLIIGATNIGSTWSMYIARYCLGSEALSAVTSLVGMLPTIVVGMFVPALCKKMDKFKLFYLSNIAVLVLYAVRWIAGYSNFAVCIGLNMLAGIPLGLYTTLAYMFTPDCAEYGCYKTGINASGIPFACQTFFAKMQSAIVTAVGALLLSVIGFVEGEGTAQAEGFANRLWNMNMIAPVIGLTVALVILHLYKLNGHDVQLMARCNAGEIGREEAES